MVAGAGAIGYGIGTFLKDQIDIAVQAVTGDKFATLGTAIFDLVEWFQAVPGRLASVFEEWKTAGANLVQALRDGITDRLKGALGIGEKLADGVAYIKSTAAQWLQVGRDIIQGLIDGIKAKAQEVVDKIKGLGSTVVREMKDLLGIKSPSRVFAVIGEQIGEGMEVGLVRKVKDVHAAAVRLGTTAIYGVRDQLSADWLKGQLKDYAALEKDLARENAAIAKEQARATERLMEDGRRLAESLRDDMDVAFDSMERYGELLEAGAITWDVYAKAVARATLDIKTVTASTEALGKSVTATADKSRDYAGRFLSGDPARAAVEEWRRAGQDIEQSLLDALLRGFEGGKGIAGNFVDTLKNMFNGLVLRPIIQPIVQAGAGLVTGALGLAMPGVSLASQASNASNLSSLGSLATSMGSLGMMAGYGTAALSGGLIGGATQAGMLAAQTGAFGLAGAQATASALGGAAGMGGGMMGAFAAALPVIGIVAALASLFGKTDTPRYRLTTTSDSVSSLEDQVGVASPFGNVGLRDAASKNIKASEFQEYLNGLAALDSAIAASLRPDKIKAIAEALDGFTSEKNEDGEKYLRRRLAVIAREIDENLGIIVESWQGASETLAETVPALVALTEYGARNAMDEARTAIEAASRPLIDQWRDQGTEMRTLLASYDGGIETTRQLAALTQSRYALEMQLANAIHASLARTQAMFASTIDEMRYSVLDTAGQYDFLKDKSAELEEALKSAIDPQTIDTLAAQINETAKQAWQLLGEDERKIKLAEYETYLEEIDRLTTERLTAAGALLTSDKQADLPDSITAAIESSMTKVAEQMMAAAQAQLAAAQTAQRVDVRVDVAVDTPASVEVGYAS